jgi:glycosyltransferase involved in cell wall biosynthesis
MKIVIVMTYWNRQYQLNTTLKSIAETKHNDFEVVVVDDASKEDIVLGVHSFPIHVIKIKDKDKRWTNPEPAYNTGLKYAMTLKPDVIIIQNAECYHVGDVISYATKVTDKTYIAFGCFSLDKKNTFSPHDIEELIQKSKRRAQFDGDLAWYNHPIYRPNAFDFCAAVTADNMRLLNGYDERFSNGHAYGDNNLIERVAVLGLKVEITERPYVVHQWHYENEHPAYFIRLDTINKLLLLKLRENLSYKAKHIYTKDL